MCARLTCVVFKYCSNCTALAYDENLFPFSYFNPITKACVLVYSELYKPRQTELLNIVSLIN